MAGYGVLQSLIGEIKTLTQAEISKAIAGELSEYKKGRIVAGTEIANYEKTLQRKYDKENVENRKKLELKRLAEEAKYAETQAERLAAHKRIQTLQLEQKKAQLEQQVEDAIGEKRESKIKHHIRLEQVWEETKTAFLEDRIARNDKALKKAHSFLTDLQNIGSKVISGISSSVTKGVNEYIGAFSKYYTSIEVGLLGTGRGFNDSKSVIDRVIGLSGAAKQTEVLEKLQEYIEKGILKDAELRATLATIGTKISNTFNSLDPTLLALTKIMQEDSTIARLGMETALTRYMANAYGDTSYFAGKTGSIKDAVSEKLLEALSQMDTNKGLEMEYAVQKWIGSFVSVGVSETTAKKIAEGIGYLTSGNITSLTSDTSLMNLIVAAANRGSVDISSILQNGAAASDIDNLLRGLYDQVSEIAESGNQVVKSQYADLYGMSISDITAMMNLTQEAVDENLTTNMGAGDMAALTEDEIKVAYKRVATSTFIDNVIDNVMSTMGEEIASNPVMNIMWKLADMATQAGGITLPAVMAMGSGLSQLPDVDQLMKVGLLTTSVFGSAANILASLNKAEEFDFSKFKNSENIESLSSSEQATVGEMSAEVATVSNTGATFIGDTGESNLYDSSMAQIKDIVELTGQDEDAEEKAASSADIDRLIQTIEEEGRKNRGEYTVQNNGPLATVKWG